jgi:hypothetical protein
MKTISKSGLSVKTAIKAGGLNSSNHNRSGLKVKAGIRAGLTPLLSNHNTRVLRAA